MKIRHYALLLLLFCLWSPKEGLATPTTDPAVLLKFNEGGEAYKKGDYKSAIKKYEEILALSQESGPLYYNLANSYFKAGQLGKAILNYERARGFLPRDGDLNFNDRYVRSMIEQYQTQDTAGFFKQIIHGHIQFYTLDEMVLIMVAVALMAGTLHIVALYGKWPSKLKKAVFSFLGILIVIYGLGVVIKIYVEQDLAVMVMKAESKFEPREDSTTHFELPEGIKIKILKVEDNWAKVKRWDGKIGWAPRDVFEKI